MRHCFTDRDTWAMVCVAGIYLFSVLIYFNIPTTDLGMYNIAIPLFALVILGIYRDLLPDVWQRHRRTLLLTLAFYCWLWVSAFFGGHTATATKYTIKYSIYFFVFPALLTLSFKFVRDRKSHVIYVFLFVFTLFVSGFGVIEYFHPQLPLLTWIRDVPPEGGKRLISLFDSSTKLGVMMAFGVLNAYLLVRCQFINYYIASIVGFLCLGIGILSGSRNFVFTLISTGLFGLFPLKVFSRREALSIFLLGAALTTILWGSSPRLVTKLNDTVHDIPHNFGVLQELLSGNEEQLLAGSTPSRLRVWYAAVQQFRDNPWIGAGLRGFSCNNKGLDCDVTGGELNTHNIFLGLLVETGIPGMLLFCSIIISILWHSDLLDPRVLFLCSFVLTSQLMDFFIHDFVTISTMIFIISVASHLLKYGDQNKLV